MHEEIQIIVSRNQLSPIKPSEHRRYDQIRPPREVWSQYATTHIYPIMQELPFPYHQSQNEGLLSDLQGRTTSPSVLGV